MITDRLETLLVGATARGAGSPVRIDGLVPFRRRFGEGVADATGPPGLLLRAVWAYFRCGGTRAVVCSVGSEPLPEPLDDGRVAEVARAVERGLALTTPALVVLPGLGGDGAGLLALAGLPVSWPDPGPLVLCDAPRSLARDPAELVALSARLLERGRGRFRLVTPHALGAAPVQGPSKSGPVSAGAMAAGLVAAGGAARIAGSGLSVPAPFVDAELDELSGAGVIVLRPQGGGWLSGVGLPRWPGRGATAAAGDGQEQRLALEESPLGPLVRHLTEALAHHAHTVRDAGLYRRVERDATSALARFFGRSTRGFVVRCDEELNSPEVVERGEVVLEVVLAPPLPVVERVVLKVTVGS